MNGWIDASPEEIRLANSIGMLVGFDQTLSDFIFDREHPKLRKRPGLLRDESWKFEDFDRYKIMAALDFWSGSGHLKLFEMLEEWDRDGWIDFIKGVCLLKGIGVDDIRDENLSLMKRFLRD